MGNGMLLIIEQPGIEDGSGPLPRALHPGCNVREFAVAAVPWTADSLEKTSWVSVSGNC
jgi:hypothetical protein